MSAPPRRIVLLGHPVGHSLSPLLQNAAIAHAGIAASYEALDVEPSSFDSRFPSLAREGIAGNLTIPFKVRAAALCDELTADAAAAGAVNTFWLGAKGICGDNTDIQGFDIAARALVGSGRNERIALLGAGGAAAAVLVALGRWPGARITVWSRRPEQARNLVSDLKVDAALASSVRGAVEDATLVVNATPIGLSSDEHPVALDLITPGAALLDLVYRRGETAWVRAARGRGFRAADGLSMLIEQGALAFARWFDREPDRNVMWAALLEEYAHPS